MAVPNPESRIPNPGSPRFVLVAGEASGDVLGAGLIAALRERYPTATFAGVGGPRMQAAGFDAWHASDELAVMGLAEVVRHLPRLLALRRDVRRRALAYEPDVFIGIDAPDFNLGLERKLKRAGLRTVHYVSPSIWAWRSKRARTIGESADLVLCLFPFEPAIYAKHGVAATFVGHPTADAFALDPAQAPAREALGLPNGVPVLALLPGSRLGEIRRLSADFIGAAMRLRESCLRFASSRRWRMRRVARSSRRRWQGRDSGFGIRDSPKRRPIPNPESRIRACPRQSRPRSDDRGRRDPARLGHRLARSDAREAPDGRRLPNLAIDLSHRHRARHARNEPLLAAEHARGRDLVPEIMQDP